MINDSDVLSAKGFRINLRSNKTFDFVFSVLFFLFFIFNYAQSLLSSVARPSGVFFSFFSSSLSLTRARVGSLHCALSVQVGLHRGLFLKNKRQPAARTDHAALARPAGLFSPRLNYDKHYFEFSISSVLLRCRLSLSLSLSFRKPRDFLFCHGQIACSWRR